MFLPVVATLREEKEEEQSCCGKGTACEQHIVIPVYVLGEKCGATKTSYGGFRLERNLPECAGRLYLYFDIIVVLAFCTRGREPRSSAEDGKQVDLEVVTYR